MYFSIQVTSPNTGFATFSVAHGLGTAPAQLPTLTMESGGSIWFDPTTPYDAVNFYLHASAPSLVAVAQGYTGAVAGAPSVYCTTADVYSMFPRFVPNQTGSIADTQVATWIADASSQIHSAFYQRGIDSDNLTNPIYISPQFTVPSTADQSAILQELARAYGVAKLGLAIFATLSAAEQAIVRGSWNLWQASIKLIASGFYDSQFAVGYARVVDISPGLPGAVAGAEVPDCPSPWNPPDGLPRYFWRSQVF